ncbi:MAG TPA: hypothetical protein PKV98_01570 [Burkholderiaceae bacterium]|nr:hypothetical protein [Burkholderiaceae bacterium]
MKLVVLLLTTAAVLFVTAAFASHGVVALCAAITWFVAGCAVLDIKSRKRDKSVFAENEYAVDPSDTDASPAARELAALWQRD